MTQEITRESQERTRAALLPKPGSRRENQDEKKPAQHTSMIPFQGLTSHKEFISPEDIQILPPEDTQPRLPLPDNKIDFCSSSREDCLTTHSVPTISSREFISREFISGEDVQILPPEDTQRNLPLPEGNRGEFLTEGRLEVDFTPQASAEIPETAEEPKAFYSKKWLKFGTAGSFLGYQILKMRDRKQAEIKANNERVKTSCVDSADLTRAKLETKERKERELILKKMKQEIPGRDPIEEMLNEGVLQAIRKSPLAQEKGLISRTAR
jgi:hypothetical protein